MVPVGPASALDTHAPPTAPRRGAARRVSPLQHRSRLKWILSASRHARTASEASHDSTLDGNCPSMTAETLGAAPQLDDSDDSAASPPLSAATAALVGVRPLVRLSLPCRELAGDAHAGEPTPRRKGEGPVAPLAALPPPDRRRSGLASALPVPVPLAALEDSCDASPLRGAKSASNNARMAGSTPSSLASCEIERPSSSSRLGSAPCRISCSAWTSRGACWVPPSARAGGSPTCRY